MLMAINIIMMLHARLAVHRALTELAVHTLDPNPNPNTNLNVYWTFRKHANSRIDNLRTRLSVDKSVRGHDNSQTVDD